MVTIHIEMMTKIYNRRASIRYVFTDAERRSQLLLDQDLALAGGK